ncbi:MAG: hypothetical protein HN889_04745, partial [Rhodospirillaceae bacterium]|nr:hypothetical protein [Rhodospirillaceae bacterium]
HGCEYMTGGCVVVLGDTGRNFAAGMSGGIAYVLDQDGDFDKRCNMAQVELEPVVDDGAIVSEADLADMTAHDAQRLKAMIQDHFDNTASSRAKEILDDWQNAVGKFVKIMPVDFRRALEDIREKAEKEPIAVGAE